MQRYGIPLTLLLLLVFMQTGCLCWRDCPQGNDATKWHTPVNEHSAQ
jgi:hypothetical protein